MSLRWTVQAYIALKPPMGDSKMQSDRLISSKIWTKIRVICDNFETVRDSI